MLIKQTELAAEAKRETSRPWWWPSLTTQIFIALFLGVLIGYVGHRHDFGREKADDYILWDVIGKGLAAVGLGNGDLPVANADKWHIGDKVYFLRDIFLHLIKSIIAPLVFSTLVVGIAGGGDIKKVGRMGVKALVYFEIVTTLALVIGLLVVNVTKPGYGVELKPSTEIATQNTDIQKIKGNIQTATSWRDVVVHVFPTSVIDSMARGDVLQIVAFSVIFAIALTAIGEAGRPVLAVCESLSQIMFRFTSYVMLFAPIGVGAAIIHTVDAQGLTVLINLGKLIGSLYLGLAIFVIFVLGAVMAICRVPVLPFLRCVREPATIAFATTSSESALPKALENVERFGVPARIAGFVMPTGYSFNLDGSTLYLAMASVFVAQAAEATTGYHMSIGHQIGMMMALMLTSKGVAAVPRASLVILLATLDSFLQHDPSRPELATLGAVGVFIIFGVDEIMDMGRTCVNLVGNCLATVVVARWEGEFDDERARAFGTPREAEIAAARAAAEPVVPIVPA
ncbi:MAG: cation:dicarboxylase symporter family transporter [Tepidisphaeraceae bacterium]